jgi:hypothetical protein
MDTWSIRKNEPKTNPNEAKVKIGKMNITIYITKGYDKTGNSAPKKTNPKQTQFQSQYILPCMTINTLRLLWILVFKALKAISRPKEQRRRFLLIADAAWPIIDWLRLRL